LSAVAELVRADLAVLAAVVRGTHPALAELAA
jgi:hypothetical protein